MKFEWDESKNRINMKKHKLKFAQVIPAFFDPLRKVYYDDKHSSIGEDRYILAGFAPDSIMLISFTEPDSETIHIIPARRAKKYEVEAYYNGNG